MICTATPHFNHRVRFFDKIQELLLTAGESIRMVSPVDRTRIADKNEGPNSVENNDYNNGNNSKKHRRNDDDKEQESCSTQAAAAASSSSTSQESHDAVALPITPEGSMPQKRFYRSRAHCNPLSHNDAFDYPASGPDDIDWTREHYPNHPLLHLDNNNSNNDNNDVRIQPDVLDIGCGFGGLTMSLSTLLPTSTVLGIEIRAKVCEYVRLRIAAHRKEHPGKYENCSVLRHNAMKFLPFLLRKRSARKLFFCFPDPHFKRRNHCRRIISGRSLTEYAHLLGVRGRLYCITDVEELHQWHVDKCDSHPLFRRLTAEEMTSDPCVEAMKNETEEGKKVSRAGAAKYYAVYERIDEEQCDYNDNHTHEGEGGGGGGGKVEQVHAGNFFQEGQFGVVVVTKGKGEQDEEEKEST